MTRPVLALLTALFLLGLFPERVLAQPAAAAPVAPGLQVAASDDSDDDTADEPDVAPDDEDEGEPSSAPPAPAPNPRGRLHPPAPSAPAPSEGDSE